MIPYGKQVISNEDIDSVVDVLKSDFLTQGPVIPKFEQKLCKTFHASYALAVNSATSGLHIACLALDVKKGDIVWTSPISFVASSNCAIYCGAEIDFVDIDKNSFNMSITSLEAKLEKAHKENKLPKVVIPVHLGGEPCNMKSIKKLSLKYGFSIIEDASHAVGAFYGETKTGSCSYSDITVFSFHPVKIITTGEGGAVLTNNKRLFNKLNLLRSHGITRDNKLFTKESDGPWYYQQLMLGYNFRMTDIQAALGISQLDKLDKFLSIRHKIASFYDVAFENLPVSMQERNLNNFSSLHLYLIRIDTNSVKQSHRYIFEFLRNNGIGINIHYIPIHLQPFYKEMGFKKGDFPNSEYYYDGAISLPIHPSLTNKEQKKVISVFQDALKT